MAFLVDVVKQTVEHRRQHKEEKWNDFLQLMIDAATQERGERSDEEQDINAKNNTKQTSATGKVYFEFTTFNAFPSIIPSQVKPTIVPLSCNIFGGFVLLLFVTETPVIC